jgi:pimeloyl-ACP methyl ester carboxylesterase
VPEDVLHVPRPDGAGLAIWRSGEGPPLVLVHGTTVNHTDWAPVLPALRQRFTVYAVDRRGCGASGDAREYALAREFEDVAAVVDSIGGPVALLGHSFGALCSLGAARLTPNLSKLVLYEPPIPIRGGPQFHPPDLLRRLQALLAAGQGDEVVATFLREVAGQDERRVMLQRRTRGWPERVAAAHTVVRDVASSETYELRPERLRDVAVPALMLLGGASPPKHIVATNAVGAALPNARIATLPGQAHIAMHTATRLFLDTVLPFLTNT